MECESLNYAEISDDDVRFLAKELKANIFSKMEIDRVEYYLGRATREFLRKSWAWRYHRERFVIPAGDLDHQFLPLDGAQVFKVLDVIATDENGDEYLLTREGRLKSSSQDVPNNWMTASPAVISIEDPLGVDLECRAHVVLIPTKSDPLRIPDDIFAVCEEGINELVQAMVMEAPDNKDLGYFQPVQSNVKRVSAERRANEIRQRYLNNEGPNASGLQSALDSRNPRFIRQYATGYPRGGGYGNF